MNGRGHQDRVVLSGLCVDALHDRMSMRPVTLDIDMRGEIRVSGLDSPSLANVLVNIMRAGGSHAVHAG